MLARSVALRSTKSFTYFRHFIQRWTKRIGLKYILFGFPSTCSFLDACRVYGFAVADVLYSCFSVFYGGFTDATYQPYFIPLYPVICPQQFFLCNLDGYGGKQKFAQT